MMRTRQPLPDQEPRNELAPANAFQPRTLSNFIKPAGDLPVDAHELIALCAPRPTFVSHGLPEKGDAKWLDHQGSFMAAVAAAPVFRLLGAPRAWTLRMTIIKRKCRR